MKRIILALVASAIVATAVLGSAASLGGITSGQLSADDAAVTSCDTDGVRINYRVGFVATTGFAVTNADVTNIAVPACEGHRIEVVLTENGASIAQASATVSTTGAANLTFSPPPAASRVNDVHISIL